MLVSNIWIKYFIVDLNQNSRVLLATTLGKTQGFAFLSFPSVIHLSFYCTVFQDVEVSLYLGVQAHPAAVQGVFAESWGATHVVLPCGGVDHFQGLVADRPVHAEVRCLAWLPGLSVANTWNTPKCFHTSALIFSLSVLERSKQGWAVFV